MHIVHAHHKEAIVFSLVKVLAKLFHRLLDVSWGPTQRVSGGRSGTLRDTWSSSEIYHHKSFLFIPDIGNAFQFGK